MMLIYARARLIRFRIRVRNDFRMFAFTTSLIKNESVRWASVVSVIVLILSILDLLIILIIICKTLVLAQKLLRVYEPLLPPLVPDARWARVLLRAFPEDEGPDSVLDGLLVCENCITQTPILLIHHLRGDVLMPERQRADTDLEKIALVIEGKEPPLLGLEDDM